MAGRRMIRDWTDSQTMNKLSWQEEVLFTRLIMKADDFGNFYRSASLVKSLLFPRKDDLRSNDIDRWLKNLEAAGLILAYPAKGEIFLHIRNFGQRLDKRSRKFPEEPPGSSRTFPENPGSSITEENRTQNLEPELEEEGNARARKEFLKNDFDFSIPPSQQMCEGLFEKSGHQKELGAKFFHHYNATGWTIKGSPITNWGSLATKWIIDEKNFNNGKQQSTGNNRNSFSNKRDSLDRLENLAQEVIRNAGGGNG